MVAAGPSTSVSAVTAAAAFVLLVVIVVVVAAAAFATAAHLMQLARGAVSHLACGGGRLPLAG